MVHVRFSESYIHFALMYTAYHILPVLPIRDMINEDDKDTTPYKLGTGMKHSISHLHVLHFLYVVLKSTSHVGTKALNMRHQGQKGFAAYLLESHSIKKCIFFMYHTKGRLYLRKMLFLMRVPLVSLSKHHNHMKKLWLLYWLCHTLLLPHLHKKKLAI